MPIVNIRNTEVTLSLVDMQAQKFVTFNITIPGNRSQRNNAAIRAALRSAHEAGELECSPDAPYDILATSQVNEYYKISESDVRKYGEPYQPVARVRSKRGENAETAESAE